eukprot:943335_1
MSMSADHPYSYCKNSERCDCCVCGRVFESSLQLESHRREDSQCKLFRCMTCARTFSERGNLRRHRKTHTGLKPYRCLYLEAGTICNREFAERANLKRHIMRIHTHIKPYKCSFCGKGFADKDSLTVHTRFHTGERPFRCAHCSKRFARKFHVKRHEQIHSKNRKVGKRRGRPNKTVTKPKNRKTTKRPVRAKVTKAVQVKAVKPIQIKPIKPVWVNPIKPDLLLISPPESPLSLSSTCDSKATSPVFSECFSGSSGMFEGPPAAPLVEPLSAPTAPKPRRPSLVTPPARLPFCGFGELSQCTTPIAIKSEDFLRPDSCGRFSACSVIGSPGIPDVRLCTPSPPHNEDFEKQFYSLSWPTQSVMMSVETPPGTPSPFVDTYSDSVERANTPAYLNPPVFPHVNTRLRWFHFQTNLELLQRQLYTVDDIAGRIRQMNYPIWFPGEY